MKTFLLHLFLFATFSGMSQTHLLKNINESGGQVWSIFQNDVDDGMFIKNSKGNDPDELWYSDGTENGTVLLKTFNNLVSNYDADKYSRKYGFANGKFIFVIYNNDHYELWASGGTTSSTVKIDDLSGALNSYSYTGENYFYFDQNGLKYTDGASTTNISGSLTSGATSPLLEFEGSLYFVISSGVNKFNIQSHQVSGVYVAEGDLMELYKNNNNLYALAYNYSDQYYSFQHLNEASNTFEAIFNFNSGTGWLSNGSVSFNMGNSVYVEGRDKDATSGNLNTNKYTSIWKLQGSTATQLFRIEPEAVSYPSFPWIRDMWNINDQLYFSCSEADYILYSSNGSTNGTSGINVEGNLWIDDVQTISEKAFFYNKTYSNEGIVQLYNQEVSYPSTVSGKGNYINGMAIMGDNLYFILDETPSGREIYYFNTGDSGAEEPSADFSANSNSINEGQAVSFTDLSTGNPTSWLWDFGDGNTSEEQNPEHTFTSEGIYTISLSAMNNEGSDTEIKNNYITVVSSNSEYQLETSFEPFELIDDLIQLSGDEPWDDPNYVIDIPSEMNALGINVDYIVIADGFVACFNHETNESVYIYVFGNDMIDRGMLENISKSKIGYKIIEQDGQIELIVQWENVGSYYEYLDYGTQNLFVNYQFKYDGKNETYEFNYGSNNITDSINFYSEAPGPYIGLEKYDDEMNIIKPNYFITDSPLSPSFGINDVELSGTPPENISYYIYKEANSIAENFISPNISINPNPSTGNFLLSEDVSLIEVFNSNGKQIISEKSKNSINLMNFPQGVYYAKIKIGGTFIVKKIVKI